MKVNRGVIILAGGLLVGGLAAVGQQGAVPAPGDPTVFYMFLRHHDSLMQDVKALTATDPVAAQNTRVGAAASMHVTVADFLKIADVYQQLEPKLRAIDEKANAYQDAIVSGAAKHDISVIRGFTASRNLAITQARAQLQSALTPAGWQAVSAFIEGEFRGSVRVSGGGR